MSKAHCAVYVQKRAYGRPGPCESRRGVKRVKLGDTPFMACIGHQNFIKAGKIPAIISKRAR